MSGELVQHMQWEKGAIELAAQYAGFVNAADLSPEEQIQAVATLVPVALEIVDEARDTIERQTNELNEYKLHEIETKLTWLQMTPTQQDQWWKISIAELDNLTPDQMVQREKIDDLLGYVRSMF